MKETGMNVLMKKTRETYKVRTQETQEARKQKHATQKVRKK